MLITRRNAILAAAAVVFSKRGRTAEEPPSGMITLSPRPADLEMPSEGFLDEITPARHFFVRCHTYVPQVKLSDWKLKVGGLVENPVALTLTDLKKLPNVSIVSVLECAGNGRSFYEPHLPGAQWRFGAVGNARWTGVRVRDLLKMAGVKPTASQVLLDGADLPLGTMPDFKRTLPVRKALDADTLLAWEMNGEPLSAEHGFPLRVIAPGWAGDSWVKWLQSIELLDHDFDGFWMKTAYRHPVARVSAGASVDAKDMVPVEDLKVKSAIAQPGDWVRPGMVSVAGVAWSNASPVTKLEVSTDAGNTWGAAKLRGAATKYGFRRWTFDWRAAEGQHTLIARATNAAAQTQPLEQEWNPAGYLWNVAQPRVVVVSKSAPPVKAAATDPAAGAQPQSYAACLGCHDEHMMQQQHLTREQWDREIGKMTGWGAQVSPAQRDTILDYLASHFRQ
jgi:sulfite oxidase